MSSELLTPDQQRFCSTHTTHHTSAQALNAIGNKPMVKRDTEIFNIVVAAARNGIADLSGREIQQRYELVPNNNRIDTSTISGCLSRLIAAKRLERTTPRLCRVTGSNIVPVRPVAKQVRLVS